MTLRTLTATTVLLTALGCGSGSTGPAEEPDYFPMQVGSNWSYAVEGTLSWTLGTLEATGTMERVITGDTLHSEGFPVLTYTQTSSLDLHDPFGLYPDTTLITADTGWVYSDTTAIRVYRDLQSTEYETLLLLPVSPGESWVTDPDDPSRSRRVESLSEQVSFMGAPVPCAWILETDSDDPDYDWNEYYADGIGIVQMRILEKGPVFETEADFLLTDYTI